MPAASQEYALCDYCLRRQGTQGSFVPVEGKECFVCGGMMDRLPAISKAATRAVRRHSFDSFAVGVSLPTGIQENEDELRSALKLKGFETIKSQASKIIASQVAEALGKRIDRQRPDLTVVVDLETGEATVNSKPIYYYGRYTKPAKVYQRRVICPHCSGAGCKKCGMTGFERSPSVEGALREKFAKITGSSRMTFTWLGSEDRDSVVYSPGRPFVVEVKNPVKRDMPKKFGTRVKRGLISVSSGKALPSKPVRLPAFRFRTEILGKSKVNIDEADLAELRRRFRGTKVTFERPHDRPAVKTVYRASAKARGRTLVIDAELDGGLPVKRFVSGELVSPSVSEVLKTEVRCRKFDICGVKETGVFEFAEVAR